MELEQTERDCARSVLTIAVGAWQLECYGVLQNGRSQQLILPNAARRALQAGQSCIEGSLLNQVAVKYK